MSDGYLNRGAEDDLSAASLQQQIDSLSSAVRLYRAYMENKPVAATSLISLAAVKLKCFFFNVRCALAAVKLLYVWR